MLRKLIFEASPAQLYDLETSSADIWNPVVVFNSASDWTGLKAIPALLPLCADKDAVLLDVPSYSQTDDYSCGAIAAWSIVETFRPRANFQKFYDLVSPEPGVGVGPKRVLRALKKFGIGTHVRSNMEWKDIPTTIDEGFPMLVSTGKEDTGVQGDHWSTLYGYAPHYRRVFLGNQHPVQVTARVALGSRHQRDGG